MSALSNMLRPASRQISIRGVAPLTSVSPQARKKSLPPPNVPVPRLNTGTLKPDPPSCLNSMLRSPSGYDPAFKSSDEQNEMGDPRQGVGDCDRKNNGSTYE